MAADPGSTSNLLSAVIGALGLIGGGILTAFAKQFTFGDGREIRQELREELKKRLPGYMLPERLARFAALPLSRNGKTDRAALLKSLA